MTVTQFPSKTRRYAITLIELPPEVRGTGPYRWQADCGNDHGRGVTPGDAVDALIMGIERRPK